MFLQNNSTILHCFRWVHSSSYTHQHTSYTHISLGAKSKMASALDFSSLTTPHTYDDIHIHAPLLARSEKKTKFISKTSKLSDFPAVKLITKCATTIRTVIRARWSRGAGKNWSFRLVCVHSTPKHTWKRNLFGVSRARTTTTMALSMYGQFFELGANPADLQARIKVTLGAPHRRVAQLQRTSWSMSL